MEMIFSSNQGVLHAPEVTSSPFCTVDSPKMMHNYCKFPVLGIKSIGVAARIHPSAPLKQRDQGLGPLGKLGVSGS